MSEHYTDDDVTAAAEALIDANHGLDVGVDLRERDARAVLDSVAPAIAARALREAADEVKWSGIGSNPDQYLFMVWLRARAELVEREVAADELSQMTQNEGLDG